MTALERTESERSGAWERLVQSTNLLCVLFFFAGFPALIYQLVWQRALFRLFGVNIESVTVVVTAFLLGLGIGALAGGWLSGRRRLPLLPLLAAIELTTGAFGLVSLRLFDRVGTVAEGLPLPLMAVVALALVIVPTLLMGATLPVLVGHFVRRSGNVGSAVGLLYYVNTLGAGAACLLSAVLLFPFLGMQGAVYFAATMNAAVGAGALIAHYTDHGGAAAAIGSTGGSRPVAAPPVMGFGLVLALSAAGGFVSLSYEIFFFRTVSYATGSSATAFAVTLSAFLVGLASGSRQAGDICENASQQAAMRPLMRHLMTANLVGFLFLPLLAHLSWLGRGLLGAILLMVYLLARSWGALLPYLAHAGIASDERAGMRTALLYLANIAGAAAGCIITGFVLMDRMSLVGIEAVLVVAGLGCGVLLIAAMPIPRRQKLVRAVWATALGAIVVAALPHLTTPVLEMMQWKRAANAVSPFVKVVENRSGIITVDKEGTVWGNGMYDGQFNTDLVHDTNGVLRPYALSLFHPAPRDVLMIGLASGSWAQIIASNPEVASLTIVEINPGYLELVAQAPEVASVLANPKVRVVTDDGRRWLRLNRDRFDAIVSNTTWHFRANVTNLLSAEFLTLIRDHLRPDGIFFYNTTSSDRVQRTGCLSFPHGARFTNHMVVSDAPIRWDFARWRATLEAYRIDGRPVFHPARADDRSALDNLMMLEASLSAGGTDAREMPIEHCADVLARTSGMAGVTDDNMGSEWRHFFGLQ
jgi:spermidine synthase